MKNPGDKVQLYCNSCLGERNHTILFSRDVRYEEQAPESESHAYYDECEYILAECKGCEHITLFIRHYGSDHGATYTTQYPPKVIRREPQWLIELLMAGSISNPYKYDFMQEIYTALRNNTPRLAVIGTRALLEQIMIEKVGEHHSFHDNLKQFEAKGFISIVQREAVERLLEAGHASTHRGFKVPIEEVLNLMDILENLIESIYINREKTAKMEIPPRPPRKKA